MDLSTKNEMFGIIVAVIIMVVLIDIIVRIVTYRRYQHFLSEDIPESEWKDIVGDIPHGDDTDDQDDYEHSDTYDDTVMSGDDYDFFRQGAYDEEDAAAYDTETTPVEDHIAAHADTGDGDNSGDDVHDDHDVAPVEVSPAHGKDEDLVSWVESSSSQASTQDDDPVAVDDDDPYAADVTDVYETTDMSSYTGTTPVGYDDNDADTVAAFSIDENDITVAENDTSFATPESYAAIRGDDDDTVPVSPGIVSTGGGESPVPQPRHADTTERHATMREEDTSLWDDDLWDQT